MIFALMLSVGYSGATSRPEPAPDRFVAYARLSEQAEQAAWRMGLPAPGQMLHVLVQLRTPPLALAGSGAAAVAAITQAQDALAELIVANGGREIGRLNTVTAALAVQIDSAQLSALRAHPAVLAVLPINDYATTQASGADTLTLAELNTLIGSNEVRRLFANTGQGVDLAVVDSGVDYTHRKLGGPGTGDSYFRAYCGGALLRPGDPACDPSIDPPLDLFPNAKVRGGYDYLGDVWPAPDARCLNGPVCIFPDRNPIDGSGHGTHVADIAAGRPLSADGSDAGVAPGANVWAFKACNGDSALCEGTALLLAIDHALDLDGSNRGRCRPDLARSAPPSIRPILLCCR
ncbi:MAG: S8 family serine peptidase [Oscillochloris sp.]|nr:S8 family serine peptidase [Oscillochloris sp.]